MPKDYAAFKATLGNNYPEEHWQEELQAMWYAAKDDWEKSHVIAQELHTLLGSLIHAYLHRKEGDAFNAGYWYRKAGESYPNISLDEELQEIVARIL